MQWWDVSRIICYICICFDEILQIRNYLRFKIILHWNLCNWMFNRIFQKLFLTIGLLDEILNFRNRVNYLANVEY